MPKVTGVKFIRSPKIYYFDPVEFELTTGDYVVVETARGLELGKIGCEIKEVKDEEIVSPLKPVLRLATEKDIEGNARLAAKYPEIRRVTKEKIEKSNLNMKLVDVEYTLDGSKLTVYFTADSRVDFRDLVRELASAFKTRIELRQIGTRDECKRLGGIAPCGRACCCSDHLAEYAHVSIKMAKNQSLSLNPGKISGLCGRLMCCLQYENAVYTEINKRMPKMGSEVTFGDKKGTVVSINQLKEILKLKVETGDNYEFIEMPLTDIKFKGKTALDEVSEDKNEKIDDELKNLID